MSVAEHDPTLSALAKELSVALLQDTPPQLSAELIKKLVPESTRMQAEDCSQFEPLQIPAEENIHIVAVEHNATSGITYENDFQQWLTDLENYSRLMKESREQRTPLPPYPKLPEGIDPLHADWYQTYETFPFAFDDRILFSADFRIWDPGTKLGTQTLYVAWYKGIRNAGLASEFFTRTLPEIAKVSGCRYLVVEPNSGSLDFFQQKLGHVFRSELTAEAQDLFAKSIPVLPPGTIQFFYQEDIEKYVQPEYREQAMRALV